MRSHRVADATSCRGAIVTSTPKPAHTPGPWTLNVGEIWGPTEPKGHDGRLGRLVGFTDADARLIAAAPELRDLAQMCSEKLTEWGGPNSRELLGDDMHRLLTHARALLARIDGTATEHRCPTCDIPLTAGDRTIGRCSDGHKL